MEEIREEEEEECIMIGNDFNTKTGDEGDPIETEERKEGEIRKSRDKMINRKERIMLNKINPLMPEI